MKKKYIYPCITAFAITEDTHLTADSTSINGDGTEVDPDKKTEGGDAGNARSKGYGIWYEEDDEEE